MGYRIKTDNGAYCVNDPSGVTISAQVSAQEELLGLRTAKLNHVLDKCKDELEGLVHVCDETPETFTGDGSVWFTMYFAHPDTFYFVPNRKEQLAGVE